MARDVPELCWSLSLGLQLSLDLSFAPARANTSWLTTVGVIQRVLLSRFADFSGEYPTQGESSCDVQCVALKCKHG